MSLDAGQEKLRATPERHAELLGGTPAGTTVSLGAFVVSASRPAGNLRSAVELAHDMDARLVVLASGDTQLAEALAYATEFSGLRMAVIPITSGSNQSICRLRTDEWKTSTAGLGDLSVKRNLGLLLARLNGWQSIFFLDDDIRGLTRGHVERALAALPRGGMAGMPARHFPDNSIVCHANRLTGYEQDVFVSGSALLVDSVEVTSFFPKIYNEDWIFMAAAIARGGVVETGECEQWPYDPFAEPDRAASQEFGNVVADGLMSSLHLGGIELANQPSFWEEFLRRRKVFLEGIRRRSDPANPLVIEALIAAERRRASLTVEELTAYVSAWTSDRVAWVDAVSRLPSEQDFRASVEHLGLRAYERSAQGI